MPKSKNNHNICMNTEVNELIVLASVAEHYGIEGTLQRLTGQ